MKLCHDHAPTICPGFQDEIKCLGIEASPSFVREPEGNGVAERFIRTLKENLLWVRTFDTIEELRAALVEFARHYNKPGSSPGTAIAPQPRCEPINSRLIRQLRPAYHWQPEKLSRSSENRAAVHSA